LGKALELKCDELGPNVKPALLKTVQIYKEQAENAQ